MAATVAGIHLGPDTHANRPAAGTPPVGALYSCTDHDLIYRTDGSTWATYADLTGSGGASDWTTEVTKASDESVTNSSTLQNDDELTFAVGSGELWKFEAIIAYEATLNGDFKCDFVCSTGTFSTVYRYLGSDTTANAVLVSTGVRESGVANTTDITAGGTSTVITRSLWIEGFIVNPSATMDITFRFAQNSAQVGEAATVKAGSILRAKQIT